MRRENEEIIMQPVSRVRSHWAESLGARQPPVLLVARAPLRANRGTTTPQIRHAATAC
jgi:hypothetical protein